jgi:hypothetical protein
LPSIIKDIFQLAAWAVAVVGGLIAAFKAIEEWRNNLRWKQAEMAKTCVDEVNRNPLATAALKMLDWSGLSFDVPGGGKTGQITHEQRRLGLRTANTVFGHGDDGPFIRDAFDALFDGLERLEHFIRIELIRFEDVEPAFHYYVDKLAVPEERVVIDSFVRTYGFELARCFLERFPAWRAG